jgi:hypothetical protein
LALGAWIPVKQKNLKVTSQVFAIGGSTDSLSKSALSRSSGLCSYLLVVEIEA